MKKTFLLCILLIGVGFILGTKLFPIKHNQEEPFYFLQDMETYVAITRDLEVAERIMKLYEEQNISLTMKERIIKNEELKVNVDQFDLLVQKATTEDEILKIEEVVLANYDEIIKNRE